MPEIRGVLATVNFLDVVDILLVAILLYKLYILIKDTRAVALLKGLIVLLVANLISKWLGLNVINWLLQKTMTVVLVALPIVFQPELRRGLEQLGHSKLFGKRIILSEAQTDSLLAEVVTAVASMSKSKIGALIVFERKTGLNDFVETGVRVDGLVSSELLTNIFIPNSPLHDGAVILRENRVIAAGCILPLSEDRSLDKELGTRHRAAIGISEHTDALVVVASEETGIVSLAQGGRLRRHVETETLKELLQPIFTGKVASLSDIFNWRPSS